MQISAVCAATLSTPPHRSCHLAPLPSPTSPRNARTEAGRLAAAARILRHETDVLVGTTDPQLAYVGFLSPGSGVVEVRSGSVALSADRRARALVRSSGCLKWWLLRVSGARSHKGAAETARVGAWDRYADDHDVTLTWETVRGAVEAVAATPFEEWRAQDAADAVTTTLLV